MVTYYTYKVEEKNNFSVIPTFLSLVTESKMVLFSENWNVLMVSTSIYC